MNAPEFIAKWRRAQLSERSASQQHFLDLCELVGHDKPAAADPDGTHFTFERGAKKLGGDDGWADVWKKDFFGWEYKGKHRDLDKAYAQLLLYREDLDTMRAGGGWHDAGCVACAQSRGRVGGGCAMR
jgi:hypothetical protein